jgi:hypothetical protein
LKTAAKDARQDPEATTIIELVRKLFNLNSSRASLSPKAQPKTDAEKASMKS